MVSHKSHKMTTPLPNTPYRIQSADYHTYLELLNPQTSSGAEIGLRQFYNTQNQYWEFEENGPNDYYIRNTAHTSLYLSFKGSRCYAYPKSTSGTFIVSTSSNSLYMFWSGTPYYLQAQDNTHTVLATNQATNLDNQGWKLELVTPPPEPVPSNPLQLGRYRIRSFNGLTLLTMPSGVVSDQSGVYVKQQTLDNKYQEWSVTPLDSGRYTISNLGNRSSGFLGCDQSPSVVGDSVVGLKTSFEWELQSVGGFAWSIFIPQSKLSLGVADFEVSDEAAITLRSSDSTPSQIWFLENAEAQIGKYEIHARQEIAPGKYNLQNTRDPNFHVTASTTRPYYISSGTGTAAVFELKYVDPDGAKFTLTNIDTKLSVTVLNGKLVLDEVGTEFVVLEKSDGDPGYYICLSDSASPLKVISGRQVEDRVTGADLFAIDNIEKGEPLQMWNFVTPS